jgi:hypothetical protein
MARPGPGVSPALGGLWRRSALGVGPAVGLGSRKSADVIGQSLHRLEPPREPSDSWRRLFTAAAAAAGR